MDRKLKVIGMSFVAIVAAIAAWALPAPVFAAICPGGPGPTCIELRLNNPPTYGGLWVGSARDTGAMAGLKWINDLENVAFEAPAGKLFTSVSIELECQGPGTRLHDVQVYYYVAPGQLCEQQLIEPPLYAAKPHGAPGVNSYILDTVPSNTLCAAGFKRIEIEPQIGSACKIVTTVAFRTASVPLPNSASAGPNMTEVPRENTPTFTDGATVQTWPVPGIPGCLPDVTPNWAGPLINVDSAAPTVPPIQLCFNSFAQPTCFATPDNGTTEFSSADASAVRLALGAATPGATVKMAGYCPGVASQGGSDQIALITKTLTLAGGYTPTNWTTAFPITQPTTLDALGAGRVLIVAANAPSTLQGFTVTGGNTVDLGGGIRADSPVTLTQMTVYSNTSSAGGGAYFGGNGPNAVEGTTFVGNVAQNGGGAYFLWPATVTGTLFMSNTATSGGGAWFDDNNTVTASSFIENKATDGGGAYFNFNQPKRLVNTLFARNSASNRGAAIFVADATPLSLIHTTIASPTLALGAAVYVNGGTVSLTDTLISNHTVGIARTGGAVSEDYTLFAGVTTPYSGTVSAGGHAITGTAAFVNPAADDYRLWPDSAAINAGVAAGVATDFFGELRPQGGAPDIGYDETPYFVSCFATHNNGTTVFSSTSASAVRLALGAAATGGTVKMAGYCPGVASQGGSLQTALITQTLTLAGGYTPTNWTTAFPFSQPTMLDALSAGRVLIVTAAASLQGFSVTRGKIDGVGGGIAATAAVTLTQLTVNSNTASGPGGGAYFAGNGPNAVEGTTFIGNVAQNGGGAYFVWPATVTGTLFMSNTATSGGGAWFDDNNTVTASSFIENKATDGGGAYFNFNQPKRLVNTLFARNSASNRGAAIFVANATPLSLIHTTIASPTLALGAAVYVNGGTVLLTDTLISSHTVGIQRAGGAVSEDYTLFAGVTTPYSGTVSAGAHAITGTAAFVNPAADNYRLGPGSAAINTGVNAGVAVDFEGQPRPIGAGYDIGYDEHIPPRAWLPMARR